MKKRYIAPTMEQIECATQHILAASERINVYNNSNNAIDASQSLSNERRGWGDL